VAHVTAPATPEGDSFGLALRKSYCQLMCALCDLRVCYSPARGLPGLSPPREVQPAG
jgi:hypothetical protein